MSYAPLLSSLIIFCETLCYLNSNFTCMIENDIFQRKMCYTLVKQKLGHAYKAEPT